MPIRFRSLPLYLILSVCTCGLFFLYWVYTVSSDLDLITRDPELRQYALPTPPILTLVLFLVTCGIYGIFAQYMWGKALAPVLGRVGLPGEDRSALYLILSVGGFLGMGIGMLGMTLINFAFIQHDLNQLSGGPRC